MNKTKVSKDIKKNQGGVENNAGLATGHDASAIGDAPAAVTRVNTSNWQQKVVLSAPYGEFHVGEKLDLVDHAAMRADQLSSMLLLIHGEGLEHFSSLNDDSRQSFLWLAYQVAAEIGEILPSMTVREGAAS
jgi:hypothetical protein